ncbi:hypothetical protein PBRA_006772 [Plasmodiophora brassicae]|uniref:Uncharacterized protein n=1 Tax=Plasmodiophora brassicae TaxID=37360 RepID=A0A0G4ITM8_PLABS|nr:hypothetical protein PBRA_006772 [Plasmodiophora brassicae]
MVAEEIVPQQPPRFRALVLNAMSMPIPKQIRTGATRKKGATPPATSVKTRSAPSPAPAGPALDSAVDADIDPGEDDTMVVETRLMGRNPTSLGMRQTRTHLRQHPRVVSALQMHWWVACGGRKLARCTRSEFTAAYARWLLASVPGIDPAHADKVAVIEWNQSKKRLTSYCFADKLFALAHHWCHTLSPEEYDRFLSALFHRTVVADWNALRFSWRPVDRIVAMQEKEHLDAAMQSLPFPNPVSAFQEPASDSDAESWTLAKSVDPPDHVAEQQQQPTPRTGQQLRQQQEQRDQPPQKAQEQEQRQQQEHQQPEPPPGTLPSADVARAEPSLPAKKTNASFISPAKLPVTGKRSRLTNFAKLRLLRGIRPTRPGAPNPMLRNAAPKPIPPPIRLRLIVGRNDDSVQSADSASSSSESMDTRPARNGTRSSLAAPLAGSASCTNVIMDKGSESDFSKPIAKVGVAERRKDDGHARVAKTMSKARPHVKTKRVTRAKVSVRKSEPKMRTIEDIVSMTVESVDWSRIRCDFKTQELGIIDVPDKMAPAEPCPDPASQTRRTTGKKAKARSKAKTKRGRRKPSSAKRPATIHLRTEVPEGGDDEPGESRPLPGDDRSRVLGLQEQPDVDAYSSHRVMPNSGKHGGLDRHSGSGVRGEPKKGGAGGKGTWGSVTDHTVAPAALDKNDPNYDPHDSPKSKPKH